MRVSHVIAAVAKVSCKHGLWLVARVNKTKEDTVGRILTSHCIFLMGKSKSQDKFLKIAMDISGGSIIMILGFQNGPRIQKNGE